MLENKVNYTQRISPNTDQAKLLLSHPVLNRMTKTNVFAYYGIYSVLIAYFLFQGLSHYSWLSFLPGFFMGLLIWTLTEYSAHRVAFHWKARNSVEKIIVFIFHDVHHAYPQDVPRSITPLFFSLPMAALFYFIFKWLLGAYGVIVFAGFLLGYLLYTIIHDSTHHFPMNFPIAKQLKRNHMKHHYFDNRKNFGVSTPLWDIIFKTYVRS